MYILLTIVYLELQLYHFTRNKGTFQQYNFIYIPSFVLLIPYFSYIYVINSTRKYFIFALNHHLSIKEITRRKNRFSFILTYVFTTSQAPYSFL